MKIANGIEMLEISTEAMGRPGTINPTLIWENDNVILVDTGFPGQQQLFKEQIEKAGVPFDNINMIILTHHDIDHIGGLNGMVKEIKNNVKVISHVEEKPYIQGDKVPHKLAKLEANAEALDENMKQMYNMMKTGFAAGYKEVDEVLKDGDVLPYLGGIEVIYTPGHTIGHMCLYLRESKTLIAGDLLFYREGKLSKADSSINHDQDLALKSLKKLTQYDIENIICYHGGLFNDNANESIKKLI